jgi:hypothetical protein
VGQHLLLIGINTDGRSPRAVVRIDGGWPRNRRLKDAEGKF